MSDSNLISRIAAEKIVTNVMNAYSSQGVKFESIPDELKTILWGLCHLPSEEKKSEWIPMSEEKPMFDGKYLCCWQGKTVDTGFFLNGHFRLYGENKDNLITAWMPLPAPYKEEE